jgi:fructoselysine-6-P-deglycase FrlB-like protein
MGLLETGLWADIRALPAALGETLAAADGVAAAVALLSSGRVSRVVATGNGAAYYVAHALWLASLESRGSGPPIVAVPCGVAARPSFHWRQGDALLAVSSSGEFREVVELARGSTRPGAASAPGRGESGGGESGGGESGGGVSGGGEPARARPCVAITAHADSSLAAGADVAVVQRVTSQRAVTHTQALAGAYACALAIWATLTGDAELAELLASAEKTAATAVGTTEAGVRAVLPALEVGGEDASSAVVGVEAWARQYRAGAGRNAAAVVAGGGPAWAAALELALMLKEVARIPAEGVETREGATSAMFGLRPGDLMVSLDPEGDPLGDEAVRLCAAAGATTLRLAPVAGEDPRLAPITTLPAAAALAASLALAAGHHVDRPAWTDAYYETARGGAVSPGARGEAACGGATAWGAP